jgi:hypothetical protein
MTHKTATVTEARRYDKAEPYYEVNSTVHGTHGGFTSIHPSGLPGWRRRKTSPSPTP